MQLYIQVCNEQIITLLDSGSTHNFVHMAVGQRLGIQFSSCLGKAVTVADGDKVACQGLARELDIRIADEDFTINCYAIPLDSYDMILGLEFLRTLGSILWDFDDLCMAFSRGMR